MRGVTDGAVFGLLANNSKANEGSRSAMSCARCGVMCAFVCLTACSASRNERRDKIERVANSRSVLIRFLKGDQTILAVIAALQRCGFEQAAANLLERTQTRVSRRRL